MSAEGYRPTSQSWSPPGLNASALLGWLGVICIIAGLVLYLPALVLGVILLLIGALIPNPKGELTVTFQRQ